MVDLGPMPVVKNKIFGNPEPPVFSFPGSDNYVG